MRREEAGGGLAVKDEISDTNVDGDRNVGGGENVSGDGVDMQLTFKLIRPSQVSPMKRIAELRQKVSGLKLRLSFIRVLLFFPRRHRFD